MTIKLKRKEQEYYNMLSARYGADVAMLTQLRFVEMHRLTVDELYKGKEHNARSGSLQKLTSLFLDRLAKLLKKDCSLTNMFAEDEDVRFWAVIWLLVKSDYTA